MTLRLACALAAGALAFGAAPASAFCIFNKITQTSGDAAIVGEVIRGGEWTAGIDQGDHKCCDWQNRQCNPTGRREGKLVFGVRSVQGGLDAPQPCVVEGEAGGWVNVTLERLTGVARGPAYRLKCAVFKYRR